MAIHFEHTIEVPQPPARVFGVLDDVSQTPRWLARCMGIEVLTPGPLAAGSKLRYAYKEGSRVGKMEGEVRERVPGERLLFAYEDKMMQVGIRFAMQPAGNGTRLTHTIEITPKTFFAKLISPLMKDDFSRRAAEPQRGPIS